MQTATGISSSRRCLALGLLFLIGGQVHAALPEPMREVQRHFFSDEAARVIKEEPRTENDLVFINLQEHSKWQVRGNCLPDDLISITPLDEACLFGRWMNGRDPWQKIAPTRFDGKGVRAIGIYLLACPVVDHQRPSWNAETARAVLAQNQGAAHALKIEDGEDGILVSVPEAEAPALIHTLYALSSKKFSTIVDAGPPSELRGYYIQHRLPEKPPLSLGRVLAEPVKYKDREVTVACRFRYHSEGSALDASGGNAAARIAEGCRVLYRGAKPGPFWKVSTTWEEPRPVMVTGIFRMQAFSEGFPDYPGPKLEITGIREVEEKDPEWQRLMGGDAVPLKEAVVPPTAAIDREALVLELEQMKKQEGEGSVGVALLTRYLADRKNAKLNVDPFNLELLLGNRLGLPDPWSSLPPVKIGGKQRHAVALYLGVPWTADTELAATLLKPVEKVLSLPEWRPRIFESHVSSSGAMLVVAPENLAPLQHALALASGSMDDAWTLQTQADFEAGPRDEIYRRWLQPPVAEAQEALSIPQILEHPATHVGKKVTVSAYQDGGLWLFEAPERIPGESEGILERRRSGPMAALAMSAAKGNHEVPVFSAAGDRRKIATLGGYSMSYCANQSVRVRVTGILRMRAADPESKAAAFPYLEPLLIREIAADGVPH